MLNQPGGNHNDPDAFDVRGSLLMVSAAARRHKGLVALTCGLTIGLVLLYYFAWPPVFTASSVLIAESEIDYARDSFYVGWNTFRKDDARTEMIMMTSAPVLEEVIQREKLRYDDVYHPVLSQLSYFWERSLVGRAYRFVKGKIFPEDADMPSLADRDFARTLLDLRAGISVDPMGESNSAKLTVKGPSRRVASIANTVVQAYLEDRRRRHGAEARASLESLTAELERSFAELSALEARRLTFSEDNALTFDFQKHALEVAKLTELESDINLNRTKIAALSATLREVEAQLASDPPTLATASEREAMRMKRLEVEALLVQTRIRYRPDSPEVRDLEDTLSRLEGMLAEGARAKEPVTSEGLNPVQLALVAKRNELRSDLEGTKASLAVMEPTAARMRTHLLGLPALQTQMRSLDRELATAQEKYHVLVGKKAQAAASVITSGAALPSIRVVEKAITPARKSWPKPLILFPASLVLGIALGLGAAVIRALADGRVRREHVASGRGTVPLYGTIGVASHARPLAVLDASEAPTGRAAGTER